MVAYCRFFHLVVLILLVSIHKEALATKHVVGGSNGWDESTDFDTWSSSQTFKVGDQIEFKYTSGLHSVVELASESAYKSCNIGSPLDSLNGGSNTVKLDKAGTRYFACGTSGHCEQGMKVKITTVGADASSSSTTSPSSPADASSATTATASESSSKVQFLSFFTLIGSLVLALVQFNVW
ncbi:hypothetical protein RD792_016539 [Penstemon davidsonii]|uniref:Phytocyanin domain-containing protein n=1 Tax=Penstemon davidsonii TaxID=160366 RepID=A0ABR0CK36_9LAMI|nr:hypothetical protein RD792_016539 [Penstemon davidsonii]